MNDKIKKIKDILWELDNNYNQSIPETQKNINEATEKIVKLFAIPDVRLSLFNEVYDKFVECDHEWVMTHSGYCRGCVKCGRQE